MTQAAGFSSFPLGAWQISRHERCFPNPPPDLFPFLGSSPTLEEWPAQSYSGLILTKLLEYWLTLSEWLWCVSQIKRPLKGECYGITCRLTSTDSVGSMSTKSCGPLQELKVCGWWGFFSIEYKHTCNLWKLGRSPLKYWTTWQAKHVATAGFILGVACA